jgi:hypothetical protein
MRNHAPLVVLVVATLSAAILGYRSRAIAPTHDLPTPASVPRASLVLEVGLAARVACDEAFDLALYRSLGVELVAWEPGARTCGARRVTVKYLPSRIRRATLLERIEELAISVKVVEG